MRKRYLNIRDRIYLEDLKKAAKTPLEIKLRNVILLSDFYRYLKKKVDERAKKVT